jgi:hypothetical protein
MRAVEDRSSALDRYVFDAVDEHADTGSRINADRSKDAIEYISLQLSTLICLGQPKLLHPDTALRCRSTVKEGF